MSKQDLSALKARAGRTPFDSVFKNGTTAAPCPFHQTQSGEPFTLWRTASGEWKATCHSKCNRTWDALAFLVDYNKMSFADAVKKLGGKTTVAAAAPEPIGTQQPQTETMTAVEWQNFGRPIQPADIDKLQASRKDKTASFETFQQLGCRMKDDEWLAFPYQRPASNSFYTIKLRNVNDKARGFPQEKCVASNGFFNLQTVNVLEDVYVVEGEPDVAIMEQAGFRAVSVCNGGQSKFDVEALKVLEQAKRIFLIGDQPTRWSPEDPGEKCMDNLQRALAKVKVENVYRFRFKNAKDVCELALQYPDSFPARIVELSEESLKPWIEKEIPRIHELSNEPVKWIVDRMFPYEGLSLLAGSQGSTKSLLALHLGHSVNSGHNTFLGREKWTVLQRFESDDKVFSYKPTKPRIPVLYLDRENPEAVINSRREELGIIGDNYFRYWGQWNKDDYPPEPDDPKLLEWAKREKGFFIFDSLQQWYGGANENDNTAMAELMRKFQRLARISAGVLILHHNRKDDAIARGGTAITSIPDMSFELTKEHGETADLCKLSEIRFRMCSNWLMEYETRWTRNDSPRKNQPKNYIQFIVKSDDTEAGVISKKNDEELALRNYIDATLSENDNMTMLQLVNACRTRFPESGIPKGAGNAPSEKIKRRAKKIGWAYDQERKPAWRKEGESAEVDAGLALD